VKKMALRFRGGERLQRGRGIGGLLRVAKGLFKPLFKSAQTALTSNAAKAAGKAITNQLVESGANIATAALMGNNVNDTLKRELEAGRHNAVIGVQNFKNSLKNLETSAKKNKTLNEYSGEEDENESQDSEHEVGDYVNHNKGRGRNKKQVKKRKKKKAKIFHLHDGRVLKWE
jgi:hypothetical protein